ncbi:unnamed protein product [Notodromas monacha]|uniref:Spliceosome-associated protein CWC27 homolog n=1 Tax=Notodromas monacha TaxID=399045 RepID=A0A7R9BTS2_9CRUS|nr:unnamed protein product [Notodromas monacha]CAG0921593.1 unnamed protein product [Notodromas monacha]
MSNIYIQEPATSGKVILNTTVGPIEIELWARESKRAAKNFMQLCMEGYYDNTIFHRIEKGFIAQGGDPTGSGTGGESIYSREGKPWRDEFHSRLRFMRRGLVACADQGSQFFFTLGEAMELQNKHTIFGKVGGDTIFNMIRLEQCEVDHENRPEFPQKILSVKIVENPFPELDEEEFAAKRREAQEAAKPKKTKPEKKGSKNFKLLSFGDEAEADEAENIAQASKVKSKSFHDLGNDPKMISSTATHEDEEEAVDVKPEIKTEYDAEEEDVKKPSVEASADLAKSRSKKNKVKEEPLDPSDEYQAAKAVKKTILPRARQTKGSAREADTLKLLAKFAAKLKSQEDEGEAAEEEEKTDEDPSSESWLNHRLKFDMETPILAKDANTKGDDWYEVFDPRNPINKRRRNEDSSENRSSKSKNSKHR